MKKIKLRTGQTVAQKFEDFLISRKARGVAAKTLDSYAHQYKAIAKHIDTQKNIDCLTQDDLDAMIVTSTHFFGGLGFFSLHPDTIPYIMKENCETRGFAK